MKKKKCNVRKVVLIASIALLTASAAYVAVKLYEDEEFREKAEDVKDRISDKIDGLELKEKVSEKWDELDLKNKIDGKFCECEAALSKKFGRK